MNLDEKSSKTEHFCRFSPAFWAILPSIHVMLHCKRWMRRVAESDPFKSVTPLSSSRNRRVAQDR
jgi:hypothetical protein